MKITTQRSYKEPEVIVSGALRVEARRYKVGDYLSTVSTALVFTVYLCVHRLM